MTTEQHHEFRTDRAFLEVIQKAADVATGGSVCRSASAQRDGPGGLRYEPDRKGRTAAGSADFAMAGESVVSLLRISPRKRSVKFKFPL